MHLQHLNSVRMRPRRLRFSTRRKFMNSPVSAGPPGGGWNGVVNFLNAYGYRRAVWVGARRILRRGSVLAPRRSENFTTEKGFLKMSTAGTTDTKRVVNGAEKRVILSMGGKGGVGKTGVMVALAEWFHENDIPVKLLDLDTENKARGSLTHFFGGNVPKVNIHTPAGLDAFVDHLSEGPLVILADMGAGSGQVTYDWFDKMYPDVAEAHIAFTAVGVVTSDPASVESVLA